MEGRRDSEKGGREGFKSGKRLQLREKRRGKFLKQTEERTEKRVSEENSSRFEGF